MPLARNEPSSGNTRIMVSGLRAIVSHVSQVINQGAGGGCSLAGAWLGVPLRLRFFGRQHLGDDGAHPGLAHSGQREALDPLGQLGLGDALLLQELAQRPDVQRVAHDQEGACLLAEHPVRHGDDPAIRDVRMPGGEALDLLGADLLAAAVYVVLDGCGAWIILQAASQPPTVVLSLWPSAPDADWPIGPYRGAKRGLAAATHPFGRRRNGAARLRTVMPSPPAVPGTVQPAA